VEVVLVQTVGIAVIGFILSPIGITFVIGRNGAERMGCVMVSMLFVLIRMIDIEQLAFGIVPLLIITIGGIIPVLNGIIMVVNPIVGANVKMPHASVIGIFLVMVILVVAFMKVVFIIIIVIMVLGVCAETI
jgi:hypothetical protein